MIAPATGRDEGSSPGCAWPPECADPTGPAPAGRRSEHALGMGIRGSTHGGPLARRRGRALVAAALVAVELVAVAVVGTGIGIPGGRTDRAEAAERAAVWAWPVDGARIVLRPFVAPATPYGPGHRGVDLAADAAEVLAPAAGSIRFAGTVAGRPVLTIDHGGGVVSSWEPVDSPLTAGEPVAVGQPVGVIRDGHCVRRCVHLGVRLDGAYANPLRWLGGAVWPVLLPTRQP